ncbi:hypothetical protein FisN_14Lh131 [Fistulifera solaris]|uniref:Uncharacterized protein n=1 Tax=Fistulifera solaris TaxID=1519565 RepID=A0A1Z5J9E6_FISSO|nr:hypothetical protein FisN_14Lh131 [Fistulifera solaris]|eukprot:GAX10624.1 hypothetical protein FisN_14Lh131 [Fistulifera solaris]
MEAAMYEGNQMQMDTEPPLDNEMEQDMMALADDEWLALTENEPEESPSVITPSIEHIMTGRPPNMLYLSCDGKYLTDYHVLLRKQIQFFEANEEESRAAAQGRNKPIVVGQVGIRCMHCALVPPDKRTRGAVYFPSKLEGVYQMALSMSNTHLCDTCPHIPKDLQQQLIFLRDMKQVVSGTGKNAWALRAGALGVYEDGYGLRYKSTLLG